MPEHTADDLFTTRRGKMRLLSINDLDGRTAAAEAALAKREALVADIGGDPTAAQSMLIEHAAVLHVYAANIAAKWLVEGEFDQDSHDRAVKLLCRIFPLVGLERVAKPINGTGATLEQRAQAFYGRADG